MFAVFTGIYFVFFSVFSYQRFSAFARTDDPDDDADSDFDLPTSITVTLLIIEFIYALAVFYALYIGQEERNK